MAFLIIWAICGLIGYAIGNSKGRAAEGALWGVLLGVIGIIIIAVRKPAPAAWAPPPPPA